MNVQVIKLDAQETVQDFMKKTANDCGRSIVRNIELLNTLGIVDGQVVVAMVQASAVPGVQMLLEGDWKPEMVAAYYVMIAALEARKRSDKPAPGEEAAVPFLKEFEAAVADPIKRFIDL